MVLIRSTQGLVGGQREIAGTGVALLGLFGHAASDHRVKRLGNARPHGAGLRNGVVHVGPDQHAGAVGAVRRRTGQAFVQHARQRVDVGPVGHLVVGEPLRSHVFPGADRGAELGEFFVGGRAGDAEVDEVGEVVTGDQDVGRLDITMHDPRGVGGVEGRGDLGDDGHRARRRQRAIPFEQAVQVGALDKAHLHEHFSVDFAVVVNGNDVRFLQTAGGPRFALHPLPEDGVLAELIGHQLDRDRPLLDGVFGLVDLAHSTAAEQPFQVVGPECRPRP